MTADDYVVLGVTLTLGHQDIHRVLPLDHVRFLILPRGVVFFVMILRGD